jgi:hypothetical protein
MRYLNFLVPFSRSQIETMLFRYFRMSLTVVEHEKPALHSSREHKISWNKEKGKGLFLAHTPAGTD